MTKLERIKILLTEAEQIISNAYEIAEIGSPLEDRLNVLDDAVRDLHLDLNHGDYDDSKESCEELN